MGVKPQALPPSDKALLGPSAHTTLTDDTFANMTAAVGTTVVEDWQPRSTPPVRPAVPPSAPGAKKELFRYINEQLDCFGKDHTLFGRYQVLGPTERRTGGQAVVQFARRTDGSGIDAYALKFFGKHADYEEEAEVYRTSPLRHFMPNVVRCVPRASACVGQAMYGWHGDAFCGCNCVLSMFGVL